MDDYAVDDGVLTSLYSHQLVRRSAALSNLPKSGTARRY
jgi:hypothetical protein